MTKRLTETRLEQKVYLGDAVYASNDGYYIILTVENGIDITQEIYLEPSVLEALDTYRALLLTSIPEDEL